MLDELAERFRGNVDAAIELAARGLPARAAAFEHADIRVVHFVQPPHGFLRQTVAVEQHDRRALARHQVLDDELEARERRGAGEERMAAVMHALLAHVEQRKLLAPEQALAQRLRAYRAERASRMSECGGKTRQTRSSAS